MSASTEAVVLGSGFQHLNSYHFNHQIKCIAPLGAESVAVHYTVGSEHITSLCPITPHGHPLKRIASEKSVLHLLYAKKYRVYVVFCADLTLRVFSESFQCIQTLHTTSTALCMEFVESTSTLYIGECGYVKVWLLRPQLHSPLIPLADSAVSVGKDQWVIGLDYEASTERVSAATENEVIVIDTKMHQSTATYTCTYTNGHRATIASAVLFSSFGYLVLAFKDGTIKVLNTVLNAVVEELSGHTKAVTAVKRHPMGSSFLSCSLDGTVRVWDLDRLTECNRLDIGKAVLGMSVTGCGVSDAVQLACYSYQDVLICQLYQLESHFATINSHTVALKRVECPGTVRIMATAEDGCVRLLSPATGEVTTLFFPVFTSTMLQEVVYCPLGGLLFALLMTSEVLVLSTHTNPCSTVQLWTASQRDRIESICLCMVEWRGKTHTLLFGGGINGYIFLLHSSHFTMTLPCPAHGGCVCKLVSPEVPVTLSDTTTASTPSLLSMGSDNFLNVWSLRVNGKGDHVELKLHLCIQMETVPKHVAIDKTLLCIATANHSVKMLDISPELMMAHQNCHLPHGCLFNSMPVLSHQREDSHTDTITSLSCCPTLGLFATSSRDGHLKVWSTANQLVSEIYFGDSLVSACFSNTRGDLLVGFQRQICSVCAIHYLPSSYYYIGQSMKHSYNNFEEHPITFDPNLEFWYDPERVPTYPVLQEERNKLCCSMLSDYYAIRTQARGQQVMCVSRESERGGGGVGYSASEVVDVQITRRDSLHLTASLLPSTSTTADDTQLCKRSSTEETSLASLRAAILSGLGAMRSQELKNALGNKRRSFEYSKRTVPVKRFPAEVAPLHSPSTKLPIAPDCLVPNSTIRETIGYVPAPDPLVLKQQQLAMTVDRLLAPSPTDTPQGKMYRGRKHRAHDALDSGSSVLAGSGTTLDSSREMSGNLDLETGGFDLSCDDTAVGEEGDEMSASGFDSTGVAAFSSLSIHHVCPDNSDDNDGSLCSMSTVPVSAVSSAATPPTSSAGTTELQVSSHHERSVTAVESQRTVQVKSSVREMEDNAKLSRNTSPCRVDASAAAETKVVPMVTIPFHSGPLQTTVAATTDTPQRSAKSGSGVEVKSEKDELDASKKLEQMMKSVWFPSNLRNSPTTAKRVCDGIVSMLKSVDAATINDISTALVELKQVSLLTEAQQSGIAQVLVSRLASAKHSHTKQAILQALELLRVPATDTVILAVLPSLLDSNAEVRNTAFSALRTIFGISSRSELHLRLIEMGVLQHVEADEDKILKDLAQRLESHSLTSSHTETRPARSPGMTYGDTCYEGGDSADHRRYNITVRTVKRGGEKPSHIQRASTTSHNHSSGTKRRSGGKETPNPLNRPDMAMFQARPECQPTLPPITTTATQWRRHSTWTEHTRSPLIHRTTPGSRVNQAKKLQRLLATHPLAFSQTAPVRSLMVGAYATGAGRARRARRQQGGDFKWTEVFPVLGCSCANDGQRMKVVQQKHSVIPPELATTDCGWMLCEVYPDTALAIRATVTTMTTTHKEGCHADRGRDTELKLPKI